MRKFIVSDLHGNGEVYDSIMGYLENINLVEDVELYINGDLIDRGLSSFDMLEDVKRRIEENKSFKINYLAGNHELLMYRALNSSNISKLQAQEDWMYNGGWQIQGMIEMLEEEDALQKEKEFRNFLGTLKVYHEFDEKINNKKLLLVHAKAPEEIKKVCDLTISDNDSRVYKAVWTRKEKRINTIFGQGDIIGYNKIGKEGYFTIIGHTPVKENEGFILDKEENTLNIDGACSFYATGGYSYDKVPLVEVRADHLEILIFNHNNKIVNGYYHDGEKHIPMNEDELNNRRIFIEHSYDNRGEEELERLTEYLR